MDVAKVFSKLLSFLKLLYISLWTFKRDVVGGYRYLLSSILIWIAQKRNLTGHKVFDKAAAKNPNKVCLYFQDEKWTFKEIQDLSYQVANYFANLGYVKGESVALFMENKPEYVAIWLGLSRIGVVSALINTNLKNNALEHCIETASCRAIIFGQELSEAVKEIVDNAKLKHLSLFCWACDDAQKIQMENTVDMRREVNDASKKEPIAKQPVNFRDGMLYIYTSGTTGLPKAAIIKHSRFQFMTIVSEIMHWITKDDVVYTPLPLYHAAGGVTAVGVAFRSGCSIVFRKKFSASQFWSDCVKYDVTVIQYIGDLCRFLLAQPVKPEEKLHQIRFAYGNGLRPEIWESFTSRFSIPSIHEIYGSTEGNTNLGNLDSTVGAVGFIPPLFKSFFPNILVKVDREGDIVRDPDTGLAVQCEVNEPGELVGIINPGRVMTHFEGYTDDKAKQKKIASDVLKKGDAAFRSGDILRMDEYGYLYFMDRQGDTFRWRGENVSTAEVENVMSRAVGLKDVAVYGVSVPGNDGKAGMASIVDPNNEVNLKELAGTLKKELPMYARPVFIRMLKEMPMTGTFKLKKVDLQLEGYDINKFSEKTYIFSNSEQTYVPLTKEIHAQIASAQHKI